MKVIAAAAMLGLALTSAPAISSAQPAAPAPRQCFFAREMRSWAEAGPNAIDIRISREKVYRLGLFGPCPELRPAIGIGVDTEGHSASICEGDTMLNLIVRAPGGVGTERCPVNSVRRLSPEEAAASYRSPRR
ncbi:MAG: DUF6491 family protein [Caulobacteraceae bacterium]